MSIRGIIVRHAPPAAKRILRRVFNFFMRNKYASEMSFWKSRFDMDNGHFQNSHYRRIMLRMAGEDSDDFIRDKIVADFGSGPRGSLVWAQAASLRIGIDVLADQYADQFRDNVISHNMIYLKCTERVIPLPSDFIDVMFTLNAIDHVNKLDVMCDEIIRVLKPGGLFIGSFNLEEPRTPQEPQRLSEQKVKDHLLSKLVIKSYRIARKEPGENAYAPFFTGNLVYSPGEQGVLWVKAAKP
jgi:SAM-dependent methyltransferase